MGRTDLLDTLKERFCYSKVVVLHGMAGTGKSTVATKFAYEHSLQYHNRIWVNMSELSHHKRNAVDEIFRHILKNFYININDIKESDDISYHLESTFRRLYSERKQTLVVLDNLDEFLVIKESAQCDMNLATAVQKVISMAIQSGKGLVHILGISRCTADEQCFKGVDNVELSPFTPEESKQYLEPFPDVSKYSEDLHKASCGFPLILELFYKYLSKKDNEEDFINFLKQIKEQPGKIVLGISQYIKNCLITSLNILDCNEKQLAETFSLFGEVISIDYAKNLCNEVGTDFSCVHRLVDKGVIRLTGKGYSMHPFLKEVFYERAPADKKLYFKASLVLLYIKNFLELSKDSFEKGKLASTVKIFQENISSFNHLISLLDSFACDEKKMFMQEVKTLSQKGTFAELDPCLFFLLVRFLYYLVPISNIKSIFQFLLDSNSKENHKVMLQACLYELEWNLHDYQSFRDNSQSLECVMFKRRQLSEKVKDITKRRYLTQMDNTLLKKELDSLLKQIEVLSNEKIKTYYIVKVNKLLGNLALAEKNPAAATEYFKKCCSLSDHTFGASFWSVDSYDQLAKSLAKNGERELAIEAFDKGMEIAQNAGLFHVPVICTLFWAYAKFCLEDSHLKVKAKELLNMVVVVSYHHSQFEFLSKAQKELCINFPQYSQEMIRDISDIEIPDKLFVGMVDKMFDFKCKVTGQSTDRDEIQKEAMSGIEILKSGIVIVRERIENDKGDRTLLAKALFNWNRNIAIYCPHVMLESERKPYANEALALAERNNIGRENDIEYLKLVRDSNNNDEVQRLILEVSFLEKTNKYMAKCSNIDEQEQKLLKALENCKQNWLRLKLLVCQLELRSHGKGTNIMLMGEITRILCVEESLHFKVAVVIYKSIQNIEKTELANRELLQLNDVCLICIANLEKGSSAREKGMVCNFEMCQIDILLVCSDPDPNTIVTLMQKVLGYGGRSNSRVLEVEKEYKKYIAAHTGLMYQMRRIFNDIVLYLV